MEAKGKPEKKQRKKTRARFLKWVLAAAAISIGLVVLLIPVIVSSDMSRRMILARINASVDGRADFADLSMGWLKGIRVRDISFEDNVGRVSVKVKQISTKPHYGALLGGSLSFGQTTIDQPSVVVKMEQAPTTRPKPTAPTAPGKPPTSIAMPINKIDVVLKDGSFRITDPRAKNVELTGINSNIKLRGAGRRSDFDLTLAVADAGRASKVSAAGNITPGGTGKRWTLKGTTGLLTVEVNDLDLESLEPFFALGGVDVNTTGLLSANIESQVKDGRLENLTGSVNGENLDVAAPQLKGDKIATALLDVKVNLIRSNETMKIDSLNVKTDWADVTADGELPTTLKGLDDFLKPESAYTLEGSFNVDLAALSAQMPRTLGLKEGTEVTSGRLTGSVQTDSQADRRQIIATASLEGLKGTVEGKPAALSRPVTANARISSAKAGVSFDKLDLTAPFATINCTGTTEQIKYEADVNLAKLQAELGQFLDIGAYSIAGAFTETGQLLIKDDSLTLTGSGTVKNLNITGPNDLAASMPAAEIAYALDIDRKNSILNVDSVNAETSLGRVTVNKGIVPLDKKAKEPMNLLVKAADVDLARVRPFVLLFSPLLKDTQLAGILESSVSITSEKSTYKIATDSTRIMNFKLASADKKPFEQKEVLLVLDLDADTVEKNFVINKSQLLAGEIKVDFTNTSLVTKDGQKELTGKAGLEYDWAAVTSLTSPFLPKDLRDIVVRGKRTTQLSFASRFPLDQTDKLLANLTTNSFTLGFDNAAFLGLDMGATDAPIRVDGGLLKIEPFTTTLNTGRVNLAANIDFTKTPKLLSATQPITVKNARINDTLSRKLLAYINPIFADSTNVTGLAGFAADKLEMPLGDNIKKNMNIAGNISIDNLTLRPGGLLGQLVSLAGEDPSAVMRIDPTAFTVRDGYLQYDNMRLVVGKTPFDFKGKIGLVDNSLDMTVTFSFGRRGLRIGDTTVMKSVSVPLTGTITKPEFDAKSMIEKQLPNAIFEGIFDQLRK
ncbi:MAG: hypothetical protein JSU94_15495 [Phycisphaerales bacterium]|nr:MAG: hypothetical protein JSU94_15495 [Phycisphaerales bacterium]